MTDNRNHAGLQASESDSLDRSLDAALAKYSTVEPRAGLEARILANLRAEQDKTPVRSWWRWGLATALATLAVVVVALAWRSGKPAQVAIEHHASTTQQQTTAPNSPQPETQTLVNQPANSVHSDQTAPTRIAAARRAPARAARTREPKLDRFPSPEPLTEQEKLALEYIERFPEEASLVAQAQTNLARQQAIEQRQGQTNSQ